jgi:biopolymer transport protein ExbD
MAEINMPQKGGKRKLQTPRLDLTPMVDLGFILITFFLFTTTMARPKTMELNMPSNEHTDEHPVIPEESTITIIPVKGHRIIYYEGILSNPDQLKQCTRNGIRDVLIGKKKQVAALPSTFSTAAHKLYVLIKPDDNCKYEDVVQLLDEMMINNVPNYTIMDITPEEKEAVVKKY